MKLLKTKKYLKIFSVIICSIFIFSNKTYAYEIEAFGQKYDTDYIFENLMEEKYPELNDYPYRMCLYTNEYKNEIKCVALKQANFLNIETQQIENKIQEKEMVENKNYVMTTTSVGSQGYVFVNQYMDKIPVATINNNGINVWEDKATFYFPFAPSSMTNEEWFNESIVYTNVNVNPSDSEVRNYYISYEKFQNQFTIPGYKKVIIPKDKVTGIVSGIKKGRIWYKANARVNSFYGKANTEWGSIEWPKPITDLRKATFADNPNNPNLNTLYYYYDFDLSKVQDSQFIMINKYDEKICNLPQETIEECEERYSFEQELWIPEDAYFSLVTVTENENGGNDFDFEFKNPDTGDIENSHTENDSSPDSEIGTFFDYLYKLLNNFQSGFIYISECFTSFFNQLPFMIQAILGLAFTIGIIAFIFGLFK